MAVAKDDGLDEATASLALEPGAAAALDPAAGAAVALAEALMTQPAQLSDELVAELHQHFTDDQLAELTVDVMKWNYQKVSVALGVDVEVRPGELTDLIFDEQGHWVRPSA